MRGANKTLGQHPALGCSKAWKGSTRAAWPQLTLLLALAARFLPETRLLRMRRKDWRSDFLSDFTRESGPSIAKESLGWRVHLGTSRANCVWSSLMEWPVPQGQARRVPGQ